jgi:hypothetical protein
MPMYYFFLSDNEDIVDADGTDLPDLDAARDHAGCVVDELMFRRSGMLGRDWTKWKMSVRNGDGDELFSFPLQNGRKTF